MEILDMSLDFLVLGDEFIPMLVNTTNILDDFLLFVVVHVNLPHFKTLIVELEMFVDLFTKSLLHSGLFLNIFLPFWV